MNPPKPTTQIESDGRRRRGDLKRQQLIAATLSVIEHEGIAGVTHRSVAQEAGVVFSSATYYFPTVDDLLVGALTAAAQEYAAELAALIASGIDELTAIAQMIAQASGPGRQRALAERELTLLAARRPALRPMAQHWRTLVAHAASRHSQNPLTIQNVVAAADGICAKALLQDEPITTTEVHQLLTHLLYPPAR